jgi:hypothetical protein
VKLQDYLAIIATDPEKMTEFIIDPVAALERAGVSSEDAMALLSAKINDIVVIIPPSEIFSPGMRHIASADPNDSFFRGFRDT